MGNLLAETAGILISIIVALLIVDRYVEQQKEQQWAKVRKLTYEAIAAHLSDAITDMFIYFPVKDHRPMTPIIEGWDHPNPATVTGMTNLSSQLSQLPSAVSREKSTSDLAVEYYEAVKWDFDQIRDVLTPRVVQSSNDQTLINALVEFDNARLKLNNAIIAHKRVVTHSVFPNVIELLEQAKTLYATMCESWARTS
ncbi:MAG: hypothetical protein ACFFDN_41925 [Candidatus Hodarchaeota archaeon]